jgi:hypothetical protein
VDVKMKSNAEAKTINDKRRGREKQVQEMPHPEVAPIGKDLREGIAVSEHQGFEAALKYPLLCAIFDCRLRRISRGLPSVPAGSLSYQSKEKPEPLTPLKEALLIAVTGTTGLTMTDGPFQTPDGQPLLGSPNLEIVGRAGSSPDNAGSNCTRA